MKKLFLLLLIPFSASAANADLSTLPSQELCVLFSMTLIAGKPTYEASMPELSEELQKRGESCEPSGIYFSAANERLKRLDAIDQQAATQAQQATADAVLRQQEQKARTRQALQNMSNIYEQRAAEARRQAEQQRMKTTHCRPDYFGGVTCTTN